MAKMLMKGNEAIAVAALKGGCEAFFGYPITPQNEIPEYLARYMIPAGKIFVQAESEIASINMVYGAAGAGVRVMTSSSSPGIALMQEGISYLAGAELPCVIVNVMRGGPGLGGIQPSQADYHQITRGGGNGDYQVIAYAPENLQETVQIVTEAFDVADCYRNPVMIAVDGLIGQMMESVDPDIEITKRELPPKDWATTGNSTGETRRIINSLYLDPKDLEKHNLKLKDKYQRIIDNEQRYQLIMSDDAEILIVAYGTMARICRSALELLREEGIKAGIVRPISLWPFPLKAFEDFSPTIKGILCAELSTGQMLDDVKIAVCGRYPIRFFGRTGGMIPEPEEIVHAVKQFLGEVSHE
ncbi:MAG: 3-methyl-2-oxobutanoate dehydrogenase subunit VorB [Bacilli bacterium]|nr:3-methyl-2-oxobutanoate dehydrogenase subunit VorB [Bacilli bacterium]MDD4077646.1 3-methyl-2-oxobutanoate dehydrogenase subunit VorB [Bacilli bacterium]MDD4388145.1 3-methyl-2-oxobutanoate dehydrogenase subunit VorB [Bacilli bacterium]